MVHINYLKGKKIMLYVLSSLISTSHNLTTCNYILYTHSQLKQEFLSSKSISYFKTCLFSFPSHVIRKGDALVKALSSIFHEQKNILKEEYSIVCTYECVCLCWICWNQLFLTMEATLCNLRIRPSAHNINSTWISIKNKYVLQVQNLPP